MHIQSLVQTKLAFMTCTSLLTSYLANIIDPASCYLDAVIVSSSAYHAKGFQRAFGQRLASLNNVEWPEGFRLQHFQCLYTTMPMPATVTPTKSSGATASTSVIFVSGRPSEVMLGGVRMGSKFPPTCRVADGIEILRRKSRP